MTTGTSTRTVTMVHTATFLADAIQGSLIELLEYLGLGGTKLAAEWANIYQPAITAWIIEQSLSAVVLECTTPQGVKSRFDFAVEYNALGEGFRNRAQTLSGYYAKISRLPAGTTWRIVCTYRTTHSTQPGWSSTTLDATAGLGISLGTLARAPHATVSLTNYGGQ